MKTIALTDTFMRTITYTVYAEAGGVGKTMLAANLAKAHGENGLNVLCIDLDVQDGSLAYLLDAEDARRDPTADNLVRHMIGRPKGAFEDLVVETDEGVDVVPNHGMLERLGDLLATAADHADDERDVNAQLLRVLQENDVPDEYDVVICDPPATAGAQLFNAIYASRSLVVPLELSGKGQQSVQGLDGLVEGLEAELDIDVGVLAAVPNAVKHTVDQGRYLEFLREEGYVTPVVIGERASLIEGCWDKQCSAFHYVEAHRSRKRDYEQDTLDQFRTLAREIETQVRGVAA